MADNQANLVLEHLKALRGVVDRLNENVTYLTQGFNSLRNDVHGYRGDMMRLEQRTEARLDTIERRLGLNDIQH